MMKTTLTILLLTVVFCSARAQTDCERAAQQAKADFKKSNYSFHSAEILPTENTYFYVLRKYYNIGWYFVDSLNYYACYDSVMVDLLESKYGSNFLQRASAIADSLDKTKNWLRDAYFPGGRTAIFKFLVNQIINDSLKIDTVRTPQRVYVQIEIDTTGKVVNPQIARGINRQIDKRVIEIIKQMPDWEPAYLYGKSISQTYYLPISIGRRQK